MSEDYAALVAEARDAARLMRECLETDGLDPDRFENHKTLDALANAVESLQAERDAYKRAKAENDDRFMRERDEARAERDRLEVQTRNWMREIDKACDERDRYLDIIERAKEVTHSSSVPLGVTEARHWDRLLAETRRILSEADTTPREDEHADYREIFGHDPEPWREPLGALRLTLAGDAPQPWDWERARKECEDLVRVLNGVPVDGGSHE